MANFWQKQSLPIIGLAPMDGVTDEPRRQIQISVAKPEVMYTEFISVEGLVRKPKAFANKLFFKDNERPIVAQVFGNTPDDFNKAIASICQMGFDGIDLNMGCPARSVLHRGGGGDLIGNLDLAGKIIEKSLSGIKESGREIPLSVKTRIGKKELLTNEWLSFLVQYPLAEITVHGRLLSQKNSGPVNWEEIAKSAAICHQHGILCLGNGGIKSLKEAKEKSENYGLDGVLIGQAALENPWIFKEDYTPSQEDHLEIIIKHACEVDKFFPPEKFIVARKHFGWYCKGFNHCLWLKKKLMETKSFVEVLRIIDDFRAIESEGKIS